MPQLDVSFMCSDPLLADRFDVLRRPATVGTDGRTVLGTPIQYRKRMGVVTQQDSAEIMRREDGVVVPRKIFIATRFQIYQASVGYAPDIITWNGSEYEVTEVLPYSRYGKGFYEVIATVFTKLNQAQ